ncbi:PTS glucitol/sorbitol transporter subunit IIA [Dryocola sp. BD626]|uniref:PTS glucitol/sorbitol transporter subunit IIA n=1 Tax=Dryocola sp. BD626 TaxID=3133273 RepID=UPI003F4F6F22
MQTIYQTTITHIGQCAREALDDNMLITFREGAPADIQDFCFIHCHGELTGTLRPGIGFELNGQHYDVTAVGEVAQQNLQELGHITLRFDGGERAEYPGTVHVNGPLPQGIETGCQLKFVA